MTTQTDRTLDRSPDERRGSSASVPAIDRVLGIVAAVLLFGMSVMTTADVVGRRFFDLPFPGSYELTSLMLAAVIFVGLPLATERDAHVVVDLLDHFLPAAVIRTLSGVMNLFGAGVLAILAWQLWVRGGQLVADGAHTDRLQVPLAPFAYLAALCTALAAVALAGKFVAMLNGGRS